jgi:fructose-1,6-bisphosphatase/inositol monophosphatase family enzyme
MSVNINASIISDVLVECAKVYVLPRFRNLREQDIRTKTGPGDLVTQADMDVEEHLRRVLPSFLPDSVVMGEEGVSSGEISLDILGDHSRPVWVVDPVDGTHNFVSGRREFCVMLALVQGGVATHSWIYDVLGEVVYTAVQGQGAFAGKRRLAMRVSGGDVTTQRTDQGFVNTRFFPPEFFVNFDENMYGLRLRKPLFCAGHEYIALVNGEADFTLFSRTKPWDHVPGALLVQEAGGYVSRWDGSAYGPEHNEGGIVAARTPDLAERVLNLITKKDA